MKAIIILILLAILGTGLAVGNLVKKTNEIPELVKETQESTVQNVPLPSEEDTIRLFIQLINDDQIDEALKMMLTEEGQNWRPYLESFEKIEVVNLEKTELGSFQVNLDVKMKPESGNQPIPYFGYVNGINTKFVNLVKDNNVWKIKEIATGP